MADPKYAFVKNFTGPSAIKEGPQDRLDIRLTANLSKVNVRHETLQGRECTVVPMVMVKEGVLNGSGGPILYSGDELEIIPQIWNHKPVVVYHPNSGSACDKAVLDDSGIGLIMETAFNNDKLTAEAWIFNDRLHIDPRIEKAINNKETLELSTGLFLTREETSGVFNGVPYDAVARNFRPDHLAILPDQVGACSMNDGAGFIRNQVDTEKWDNAVRVKGVAELIGKINDLVSNELSQSDLFRQISIQIKAKLILDGDSHPHCFVEEIRQTFCIYWYQDKFWRLGYSMADDKVSLSGEPEEVNRIVEWRTLSGLVINKTVSEKQTTHNTHMEKLVDNLIANLGYGEDSRESLLTQNEAVLTKMVEDAEARIQNESKEAAAAEAAKVKPTENAEPEPTAEEYVSNAPAGIREALQFGLAQVAAKKAEHIANIQANKNNPFSDAVLNAMEIDGLAGMAALASQPDPSPSNEFVLPTNYGGQAGAANPTFTGNKDGLPEPEEMFPVKA